MALCGAARKPRNWKAILGHLQTCLSVDTDSVKQKAKTWKQEFPDVEFDYSKEAWRLDALDGDRHDWDHFATTEDFDTLKYKATGDVKWFLFHIEAKNQREWVQNRVRHDLL